MSITIPSKIVRKVEAQDPPLFVEGCRDWFRDMGGVMKGILKKIDDEIERLKSEQPKDKDDIKLLVDLEKYQVRMMRAHTSLKIYNHKESFSEVDYNESINLVGTFEDAEESYNSVIDAYVGKQKAKVKNKTAVEIDPEEQLKDLTVEREVMGQNFTLTYNPLMKGIESVLEKDRQKHEQQEQLKLTPKTKGEKMGIKTTISEGVSDVFKQLSDHVKKKFH